MVEMRLLLLRLVVHAVDLAWLLVEEWLVLLTEGNFLVLLGKIAGCTAACAEAVGASIALKVVLCADVTTADHGKNERYTKAGETTEGGAIHVAA